MVFMLLLAASSTVPAQPSLHPWQVFVGHCWRSELPRGMGTDTHCFESLYGGQHIRDRHNVLKNGKEVYGGETFYSVEAGGVTLIYLNSLGGVGRGKAKSDGARLTFTGEMRASPTRPSAPFTAEWTKLERSYEVRDGLGKEPRVYQRVD